ncbi:MAG TPA: hypothetical protein VF749_04240 [Candidatus Acidoferrum sp.]
MDHKQAIDLQLAVKYVLGELPPVQRDEYEDHYIDCPECAQDVHAVAAFADTAREVFRGEARSEERARTQVRGRGWLFWLRPAFAGPALVVLLAVAAYQNLTTIPRLKSKAEVFNSFSLVAANSREERGEGKVEVQIRKNEMFALDFDFLPKPSFDHYLCRLQDEAGRVVLQVAIPAEKERQEVHLLVPRGLDRAGEYNIVITGDPGGKGQWDKMNEVSRMNFVVDLHL